MLKSTHPITRIFWISLVVGVVIYQLNKTEYPGSDAVVEDAQSLNYTESYSDVNSCVFPAIFFEPNSSILNVESVEALDEIATRMDRNPGMKIEIAGKQGHGELRGIESERENAILAYLTVNHDIHPRRLVRAEESGEFVKPNARQGHKGHIHEHHEVHGHNGNHYEFHYKGSCRSKSTYTYSSSCSKRKRHCSNSWSSCHKKQNVKKTHRAVYITCID